MEATQTVCRSQITHHPATAAVSGSKVLHQRGKKPIWSACQEGARANGLRAARQTPSEEGFTTRQKESRAGVGLSQVRCG